MKERTPEIQAADPATRRLGLVLIVCGALAGAALIGLAGLLRPAFEGWVRQEPEGRLRIVMMLAILLTSGPLLGFASSLWHLGGRIRRAERYPPPGFKVTRDTRVVSGRAARRRGSLMLLLAAIVATAALLLAASLWRFQRLMSA